MAHFSLCAPTRGIPIHVVRFTDTIAVRSVAGRRVEPSQHDGFGFAGRAIAAGSAALNVRPGAPRGARQIQCAEIRVAADLRLQAYRGRGHDPSADRAAPHQRRCCQRPRCIGPTEARLPERLWRRPWDVAGGA
jgi:hypothetical protein